MIRDEATYFTVWTEHAVDVGRIALPPPVDFSKEMVILIALGNRPTGGYFVEVVDARLHRRTLRVLVSEERPQPGTLQVQQVTQPYEFIAMPAVQAHVVFRRVHRLNAPSTNREARPGEEGSKGPALRAPAHPLQSPRGAASKP